VRVKENPSDNELTRVALVNLAAIDAHGLKIQGRGYVMFFSKILRGQGFQEKLPGGVPYFGFYCIFINVILPQTMFQPTWHCCMCCTYNPANGRKDFEDSWLMKIQLHN
jgi:hypothetical protein